MSYTIEHEIARNGEQTIKVNGFYYYSKYNPQQDVERALQQVVKEQTQTVVIFGLGLGYHAQYLATHYPALCIIIVETEQELYNYFSTQQSVVTLLQNPRVQLVKQFNNELLLPHTELYIVQAWQKGLVNRELQRAIQNVLISRTSAKDVPLLEQNAQANMLKIKQTAKPLAHILAGKTAILVSAGPSLDTQIQYLSEHVEDAFIICVAAAYPALEKHGIQPHAIISVDPNPVVMRQAVPNTFTGLRFYGVTVYPSMWTADEHNVIALFQQGLHLSEQIAEQLHAPTFSVGGSVATWAFSLLCYMGAGTIVLVGQDLAYIEGKTHAAASSSAQALKEIHSSVYVDNNNGGQTPTSSSWEYFRTFFEHQIAQHPTIQVYNTSVFGAKIKGAPLLQGQNISYSFSSHDYENIIQKAFGQ